jgi:pimeloyl-ACP methyl ester carboxylesterase
MNSGDAKAAGNGPSTTAKLDPGGTPTRRRWRRAVLWFGGGLLLIVGLAALGLLAYVQLFPERVARGTIESWRKNAGLVRKEIELPSGLRYAYLEGGTGEPLLLLHGFGADKDNFDPAAFFLVPHYRVIVPDHIGFGESSRPDEADYSPPAQAERLHAFVQALNLSRVHLGGNSMGGQIAMAYAVAHSNEVQSLWLLDPAGVWTAPKSEVLSEIAEGRRNPMLVKTEQEFLHLFQLVVSKPPFVPGPVLRVLAQVRIRNFDLEEKIFPQITGYSVEDKVAGLAVPTLIVWGEEDRALHRGGAEILHRLLPRSEVILMPGIGHLPMLEAPQRSAEDYLRFRSQWSRI